MGYISQKYTQHSKKYTPYSKDYTPHKNNWSQKCSIVRLMVFFHLFFKSHLRRLRSIYICHPQCLFFYQDFYILVFHHPVLFQSPYLQIENSFDSLFCYYQMINKIPWNEAHSNNWNIHSQQHGKNKCCMWRESKLLFLTGVLLWDFQIF